MAYLYTVCTVCVTILVLVATSTKFQILRSYTLLLRPPILMRSWAMHMLQGRELTGRAIPTGVWLICWKTKLGGVSPRITGRVANFTSPTLFVWMKARFPVSPFPLPPPLPPTVCSQDQRPRPWSLSAVSFVSPSVAPCIPSCEPVQIGTHKTQLGYITGSTFGTTLWARLHYAWSRVLARNLLSNGA